MYAGAITLAAPTAIPPRNRQTENVTRLSAIPDPNDPTAKRSAVQRIALHAPGAVRHAAPDDRADRRAEERGGDGEAEPPRIRPEVPLERPDRAVDDGGVVAEQEAAERGDGADQGRDRRPGVNPAASASLSIEPTVFKFRIVNRLIRRSRAHRHTASTTPITIRYATWYPASIAHAASGLSE